MGLLEFQRPDRVVLVEKTENYAKYSFSPLEPGFGVTVGNSLRRVLLSSLTGFAITQVKFEGVNNEFSTIPGILEDVTVIILNLKKIRFKPKDENINEETIKVMVTNKGDFTANDLGVKCNYFEVINKKDLIFTATDKIKLNIELKIEKGRGYVPSEEHKGNKEVPIGLIFIDSIFSPILNVRYTIENFRVGQKTDYEKLIFEIFTDGTIDTNEAIKEAATVMIRHMVLVSNKDISVEEIENETKEEFDENVSKLSQLLEKRLVDMDLSVRAINCLKSTEIDTIAQLISYKREHLLKMRNFGKKSLQEIEQMLESKGLSLGMDQSKFLKKRTK